MDGTNLAVMREACSHAVLVILVTLIGLETLTCRAVPEANVTTSGRTDQMMEQ